MEGRKGGLVEFSRRRKQVKGNLTRRGKTSWRFKYDVPSNGKRATRYVTLHGTKAQAQAEAAKIVANLATGLHVDPSTETVAAFVDRWLKDWAAANVSNQTYEGYEQMLRKHLCFRVGKMVIQKLRAADLQTVYAAMAAAGLADRTRLHLHRVAHVMLKHATQWGIVPRNVADMVDAPRVRAQEIEILTAGEVQRVLESLRDKPLYAITALALASGLRRGELLALRWQDINLDGAHLRVERALEETKRGGLAFKPPKTRHGRRTVTLPMSTVAVLREHWKAQQEQRLFLGLGKARPDALVFADWDGGPRSPRLLTHHWGKAMKDVGLTATFHSLRHTHASTLIASGLDVLTISRRLGHGSPAITLNVYGHLFKPDDRAAAIMERALMTITKPE
jgi:integrase